MSFEMFELQEQDEGQEFRNAYMDFMSNNRNFEDIAQFEEKQKRKKTPKTAVNLDEFIEGDNDDPISTGLDS